MAAADAPRFGDELQDAFKPVNAWVSNGITWLEDIQQYYRERSVIEKEYSTKLAALARKYYEKKARKTSSLSVGDTPTLTPGSLESASLTTWGTQLTALEKYAAEHDKLSSELIVHVADPLRSLAMRHEDLRKSHIEYAAKLEKEKDAAFVALKRTKGQYDGSCQETESKRKKIDSSFDSNKAKAQNTYQQQLADMNNVKNTYLIGINVTNKQKERYYHEYVPDILNSMQDISETRVHQVNNLWLLAAKIENDVLTHNKSHIDHLSSEIPRNEPYLDSTMFIQHNKSSWQEPPDAAFEPSPIWHDDASMATDEPAKVYLRNILGKSKGQRAEFKREVDAKKREVDQARQVRAAVREGRDKRDEVEVVKAILALQERLHETERKWIATDVEVTTITSVVGDISIGAQNHNFKSQTFKIPTNCDLCGDRIWGLSAKGFDCKDCGYTCHSKCELKVPADCPGEQSKEDKKKLKLDRQAAAVAAAPATNGGAPPEGVAELSTGLSRSNTMNSLSSGYATDAHRSAHGASTHPGGAADAAEDGSAAGAPVHKPSALRKNRVVAPPPTGYTSELPGDAPAIPGNKPTATKQLRGKMIYPYQASGDGELTVEEGAELSVVEADDGSGWMTVRVDGATGVVPASYVEQQPATAVQERPDSTYSNSSASVAGSSAPPLVRKKGPAVAPKRGAKKLHFVEAIYSYTAQSDAEFSMEEGDRFVLVKKDQGDGWAEVERGGQVRSVPANYIQDVA